MASEECKARIRIIQVTDVYKLENFPSLKTLIDEKRSEQNKLGGKTISVLTGDFLAPYLLSSFDNGVGMMNMINKTPIDYLIWGNHEQDLSHTSVMEREREYRGVWINSNMKSHESFADSKCQVDSVILDVVSPDGSNKRRLGLCGILTNDKKLYKPGAFGGAVIDDPWDCMKYYNEKLKDEEGCDMVLPLCHLYEYQDEKTCRDFDFPVILSGHDHHRVDRMINGTRLLKPGMDANYAVILDIVWDSASSESLPTIQASTIPVSEYPPDEELRLEALKSNSILDSLVNTHLSIVPERYRPLTSRGVLERRVSMATYLCTQLRYALNMDTEGFEKDCDCVVMKGGKFRGERDYDDLVLTLEALKTEFTKNEDIYIWHVPGFILQRGLQETWKFPNSGWMQYDDEVEIDSEGEIETIGNIQFDPEKIYRVGSIKNLIKDRGGTPTFKKYFKENPHNEPDFEAGIQLHVLLLKLFSRGIWKRLHDLLDADGDGIVTSDEIKLLDTDGDNKLSKSELRAAMANLLGLSAVEGQDALIEHVLDAGGDVNLNRQLSVDEINTGPNKY